MDKCQESVKFLLDYLEGNLPETVEKAVRAHFQDCQACLRFLESYQNTSGLCRATLLQKAPEGFSERLIVYLRNNAKA